MAVRQSIAKLIRSAAPRPLAGAIRRLGTFLDPHAKPSYSQEGEDLILLRMFESNRPGFFIDVGAHHPQRFSNTFLFYRRGWRGINIDPSPEAIALFNAERPRDINLALGVSDEPGTLTYFVFDDPALNTFDEKLARERERTTAYRVTGTRQVQVARLDELLARHLPPGQSIDFMSVDAEGYDFNVVRSNDWSRFRPRYLLVECLASSLTSIAEQPMHKSLEDRRYRLFAKTVNTLFYASADG